MQTSKHLEIGDQGTLRVPASEGTRRGFFWAYLVSLPLDFLACSELLHVIQVLIWCHSVIVRIISKFSPASGDKGFLGLENKGTTPTFLKEPMAPPPGFLHACCREK